jgi:hypothetical protein
MMPVASSGPASLSLFVIVALSSSTVVFISSKKILTLVSNNKSKQVKKKTYLKAQTMQLASSEPCWVVIAVVALVVCYCPAPLAGERW